MRGFAPEEGPSGKARRRAHAVRARLQHALALEEEALLASTLPHGAAGRDIATQDLKVPREGIDQAMRAAAQSPSACNRQPFEFRVFDDPVLPKWWTKVLYHSNIIEKFHEDVVLAFDLDVVIRDNTINV